MADAAVSAPREAGGAPRLRSVEDVQRAARRIRGAVRRTPLVEVDASGETLWLKAESLQVSGSFKVRGAYNALAALAPAVRARGVVAHSSGNHAAAIALAAKLLGTRAVVFMPEHAPAVKLAAARAGGAEVVLVGRSSDERRERAHEYADRHGMTLIPSADHPDVIAGQGTVGLEIATQMRPLLRRWKDAPLTVLVPVGGGGLASGVAVAIKALVDGACVIGVEPTLAADGHASLRAGHIVVWPSTDTDRTIADGLRLTSLGVEPFAHLRALLDGIILVEEAEIRAAVACAARHAHLVAEPSGAATLAAALFHASKLRAGGLTVCVISGGNIGVPLLRDILADEAVPPPSSIA